MPMWATPEEVAAVEKEIRRIRRRLYKDEIKLNSHHFMAVPPPRRSDQSFWLTKYTNPFEIYEGNTDHWAKMRVKADSHVAKELSKKSQEQAPPPQKGCSVGPFVWTPLSSQMLRANGFKELVDQSLATGFYPGDLNAEILSKQRNKRSEGWPKDTKAHLAAARGETYWPPIDTTLALSYTPHRDRNRLPI